MVIKHIKRLRHYISKTEFIVFVASWSILFLFYFPLLYYEWTFFYHQFWTKWKLFNDANCNYVLSFYIFTDAFQIQDIDDIAIRNIPQAEKKPKRFLRHGWPNWQGHQKRWNQLHPIPIDYVPKPLPPGFPRLDVSGQKKNNDSSNTTHYQHNPFVLLATTNSPFIDLTENWLESLRRQCLQYNVTIVCEDLEGYKYFSRRANDLFHIINSQDFQLPGRFSKLKNFAELIAKRVVYINQLLASGLDVLLADIDAVWVKDPLPIITDEYSKYDMWVAQGHNETIPCPCFLYMKAVPIVVNMAEQWVERISGVNNNETDQIALMHVMKTLPDLRINRLDKVRFPSGRDFFDPDWYLRNFDQVYVAHGNHQGRHAGKKSKFKEFGIWLLENWFSAEKYF